MLSANTTINVAIPDCVIGYIYGRQVRDRGREESNGKAWQGRGEETHSFRQLADNVQKIGDSDPGD